MEHKSIGGLMKNFNLRKAFTLTEVVIVMLIIAVVAAVTIKITKAKLDSAITYQYYAAYETLKSGVSELLADADKTASKSCENKIVYNSKLNKFTVFISKIFGLQAHAALETPAEPIDDLCDLPGYFKCPDGTWVLRLSECQMASYFQCPDGSLVANSTLCAASECVEPVGGCGTDKIWNSATCQCVTGMSACFEPLAGCGTGKVWKGTPTCACVNDDSDTEPPTEPDTCEEGYSWDSTNGCIPSNITLLPSDGICKPLEKRYNTKNTVGVANCEGANSTQIAAAVSLNSFAGVKHDLVLRNGMKLYNLSNNAASIPDLTGMEVYDSTGYIVYIDVDGEKGSSTLFEDVYPFYVSLTGMVVPAFDSAANPSGGNSSAHLSTSVKYDSYTAETRKIHWLEKSVPFQTSACRSGYILSTAPYCSGMQSKAAVCDNQDADCRIIPIKPIKLF